MIILEHPLDIALSVLGVNRYNGNKRYRFSEYNVIIDEPEDGGKLFYNSVTMAVVFLTYDELAEIERNGFSGQDILYAGRFMIPETMDETANIEKLKKAVTQQKRRDIQHPTSYTILPTTSCNARCFYCYEIGRPQKVMTQDMAVKVAEYIIKRYVKGQRIRLYWFGGEPTVNIAAIDTICRMLSDAGVDFYSEMVSNGYLLTEENVKKGIELWHLTHVQITVDGTKDVYNKSKNYIYKNDPNPYERIMENIGTLASCGVGVDIRLNVGKHNFDDLSNLVDELVARFGYANNVVIYTMQIFECNMVEKRTDAEKEELFSMIDEINKKIEENGIGGNTLDRSYKNSMCGADDGHSILIAPDGHIGLCEHHTDDEFIGHIDELKMNFSVLQKWTEKMVKMDICEGCPLFSTCVKLKNCPEEGQCSIYERDMKVNKFRRRLQRYYEQAKFSQYYISQITGNNNNFITY